MSSLLSRAVVFFVVGRDFISSSDVEAYCHRSGANESESCVEWCEDRDLRKKSGAENRKRREAAKKKKATQQGVRDYEYLVGMPIVTLTIERVQELMKQRDMKIAERDELQKKSHKDLWLEDLLELEQALDERDKVRAREEKEERSRISKAKAKAGFKDARRSSTAEEKKSLKRSGTSVDKGDQLKKSKTM